MKQLPQKRVIYSQRKKEFHHMMTVQERYELNKFLVENKEWVYSKARYLVYVFDEFFKLSLDGKEDRACTLVHDTYIVAVTSKGHVQERYPSFHPFLVGIMKRLIYQGKSVMRVQSNHILDSIAYPMADEEAKRVISTRSEGAHPLSFLRHQS